MKLPVKNVALAIGLLAVALIAGFLAAGAVIGLANTLLPPFQPADDDTLRERIPVAISYLTWGATSVAIIVLGWSWWHREP
jgi:hypothetical protein